MSDMNATNAINAMNANPVIAPVLKNIIEHSGIYVSHIQLPSLFLLRIPGAFAGRFPQSRRSS